MTARWLVGTIGLLVIGAAVGCRGVTPPRLAHPGPAEFQRAEAQQFDPYPENEPGPEVVGSRPREYEKPPAEVLRARWLPWNWGQP